VSRRKMPRDVEDRVRSFAGEAGDHMPTTFTAAELHAMELPPIKWTIPDILPEGVTILAGKAKIGKSFLAFGLCVAVASGGDALGRVPVGRGSVLYLALEDNRRRLQKRLRGMVAERKAPGNLHIAIEWPRLDEGGTDRLDEWLTDNPDARLVVIDILKSIRPRGTGSTGRNMYDVDYESLEPLKPLIEKHGVSIVVVHHLNQGQSTDPLQLISGSEGLVGVVDGTLVLRRERGKHDATLHVAGKDIEEEKEHALKWDAALTCWVLMGDAEDFRLTDQRRAILDAFREFGRPATSAEASNHLDEPYENVRKLVAKMEDEGLVYHHHSEGRTKYYTTTHPNDPNDPNSTDDPSDPKTHETPKPHTNGTIGNSGRGNDPNRNPHSNADSGGIGSIGIVGIAEGTSRANDPVRALLADPPEWLATQLAECRNDPDRLKKPTSTAIAMEVFGTAGRWREVEPILEDLQRS
jgi:hypothetical protein